MGMFDKDAREARLAKSQRKYNEAKLKAGLDGLRLTRDGYLVDNGLMAQMNRVPLEGARAEVEQGATLAKGVTATRVALLGVFALAAKKDKSKVYLAIGGADGSQILKELPAKKEGDARRFATLINQAAQTPVG